MQKELLTDNELILAERNERIVKRFNAFKRVNPDASANRILKAISRDFKMSSAQLRNICKRAGAIQPTKTETA